MAMLPPAAATSRTPHRRPQKPLRLLTKPPHRLLTKLQKLQKLPPQPRKKLPKPLQPLKKHRKLPLLTKQPISNQLALLLAEI